MSDVNLSIDVLARFEQLEAGLKRGDGLIKEFVKRSGGSLDTLQKKLGTLGGGTGNKAITGQLRTISTALSEIKIKQAETTAANLNALQRQRVATAAVVTEIQKQKAATAANVTELQKQKAATEAARTAAVGSLAQEQAATQQARQAQINSNTAAQQSLLRLKQAQVQQATQSAAAVNSERASTEAARRAGISSLLAQRVETEKARTAAAQLRNEQAKQRAEQAASRASAQGAAGSYREMQQRMTALGKAIREEAGAMRNQNTPAVRGMIKEYRALNEQLKAFDARMGNHQRNVGNYSGALGGAFSKVGGGLATMLGVGSGLAAAYTALRLLHKIKDVNIEVDAAARDVKRTTQMTQDEITELEDSLKRVKTITSLDKLLDISMIGGQMGLAKSEIFGFTVAVDKLAVVLKREMPGGADEVARTTGKLMELFNIRQNGKVSTADALTSIGSGILAIAHDGIATGAYIQDFSVRVAGMANMMKISLPTILAYSGVLEQSGISAEVAGTAVTNLMTGLSIRTEKFLAVAQLAHANLTIKEFTDLVNNDAAKALELFFDGVRAGDAPTSVMTERLKSVRIQGSRMVAPLLALAQNFEAVADKTKWATDEMEANTAVTKNNEAVVDSASGSWDRLTNSLANLVQSERITALLANIGNALTNVTNRFSALVNSSSWKEFFLRSRDIVEGLPMMRTFFGRDKDKNGNTNLGNRANAVRTISELDNIYGRSEKINGNWLTQQRGKKDRGVREVVKDINTVRTQLTTIDAKRKELAESIKGVTDESAGAAYNEQYKVAAGEYNRLAVFYKDLRHEEIRKRAEARAKYKAGQNPKVGNGGEEKKNLAWFKKDLKETMEEYAMLDEMERISEHGEELAARIAEDKEAIAKYTGAGQNAGIAKAAREKLSKEKKALAELKKTVKQQHDAIMEGLKIMGDMDKLGDLDAEEKREQERQDATLKSRSGKIFARNFAGMQSSLDAFNAKQQAESPLARAIRETKEGITQFAQSGLADTVGNIFEGIGNAMATGGSIIEALSQSILNSIANFAKNIGQMLMKMGSELIITGLAKKLTFANPMAAGIMMIGAGAALSLMSGLTARKDKASTGTNVPAFATGVTNFKGGIALVGEKGPEFVTLPTGSNVITNENTNKLLAAQNSFQGAPAMQSGPQSVAKAELEISLQQGEIRIDNQSIYMAYNLQKEREGRF